MIEDSKSEVHKVKREKHTPNTYYSILTKNTCYSELTLKTSDTKETIEYQNA